MFHLSFERSVGDRNTLIFEKRSLGKEISHFESRRFRRHPTFRIYTYNFYRVLEEGNKSRNWFGFRESLNFLPKKYSSL